MNEPRSIAEFVAGAVRRARAAWASEAFALGLAAATLVDVAAIASHADWNAPAVLAVALLCGAACAATWWSEQSRDRHEIARRVDRRLEQNGALTTAFELEAGELAPASLKFAHLLTARALAALPEHALTRGIPAPSAIFVAAPLIAAAVLAFALERDPRLPRDTAELASRVAAQLISAASSSAGDALTVERLRTTAEQLEHVAERRRADPSQLAERLRQADRDLASLVAEDEPDAARRIPLQAARDATSALLSLLAETSGAGFRSAQNAAKTAGSAASAASTLANDAAPRTMSGPSRTEQTQRTKDVIAAPTTTDSDANSRPEPGSERGTVAGRWWPTQYDAIVASWLHARAESEPRAR